jgi:hypothetical protein
MGLSFPPCRWPFPRLRGVPSTSPAGDLSATGTEPLSSFALRWSLTQRSLADRMPAEAGQSISTSHGLFFPLAHQGSEVHSPQAMPDPLCSARRVWLPSRRLTPSEPVPALFRAGGARGILPLRSFLRLQGIRDVTVRKDPRAVSPAVIPAGEQQAGPAGRGFWALTLASVPGD